MAKSKSTTTKQKGITKMTKAELLEALKQERSDYGNLKANYTKLEKVSDSNAKAKHDLNNELRAVNNQLASVEGELRASQATERRFKINVDHFLDKSWWFRTFSDKDVIKKILLKSI